MKARAEEQAVDKESVPDAYQTWEKSDGHLHWYTLKSESRCVA